MNEDPIADRLDSLSPINMGLIKGSGQNTPAITGANAGG
jgi:hypothetical protein